MRTSVRVLVSQKTSKVHVSPTR